MSRQMSANENCLKKKMYVFGKFVVRVFGLKPNLDQIVVNVGLYSSKYCHDH